MGVFKDYSNQKFGRLQPIERLYVKNHRTYWKCQCDCGNIVEKPISSLTKGNCKSCGCLNREISSKRLEEIRKKGNSKSFQNLVGQKYERLTVIKRAKNNKFNQVQWLCQCDCGNIIIVKAFSLKQGETKSCGCLKKRTRL
jgi:hypothetical protein